MRRRAYELGNQSETIQHDSVNNNLANVASGASLRASIITRAKNRCYGGRNIGGEGLAQTENPSLRNSKERLTQTIDVNKDDVPDLVLS